MTYYTIIKIKIYYIITNIIMKILYNDDDNVSYIILYRVLYSIMYYYMVYYIA